MLDDFWEKEIWGRRTACCSLERGRLARLRCARRLPGPIGGAAASPNPSAPETFFEFVSFLDPVGMIMVVIYGVMLDDFLEK